MCLILFGLKSHPKYRLVIAANRDEYYERPTAPAAFWEDVPHLLAGRDLRAGGTWLGITTKGRIAAITNYRDPGFIKTNAPSRGNLVGDFLLGKEGPLEYLGKLEKKASQYNGFSLIVGEKDDLCWFSNRDDRPHHITSGIHGLSNRFLDTPWPKVTRGRDAMVRILSEQEDPLSDALFEMLADRSLPQDAHLPDTGVGLEWERVLSPIFITSPVYGTRSSTIILIDGNEEVTFIERTFDSDPENATTVRYEFPITY